MKVKDERDWGRVEKFMRAHGLVKDDGRLTRVITKIEWGGGCVAIDFEDGGYIRGWL